LEREKGEPKTTAWMYCEQIRIIALRLAFLTYLALQHTQPALEDVHDGEIDAFPVVDDFVVVDASDYEGGRVVFACFFYALFLGLFGIPSLGFGGGLFGLGDEA
jgi:hypothetical protein